MGVCRGLRTGLAEFHRFSNVQLERALVMFRCRQASQLTIPVDEPQSACDDADAHCRVAGFETLERGESDAQALCPGTQRFLAA